MDYLGWGVPSCVNCAAFHEGKMSSRNRKNTLGWEVWPLSGSSWVSAVGGR